VFSWSHYLLADGSGLTLVERNNKLIMGLHTYLYSLLCFLYTEVYGILFSFDQEMFSKPLERPGSRWEHNITSKIYLG
jgi:hypothetical protein